MAQRGWPFLAGLGALVIGLLVTGVAAARTLEPDVPLSPRQRPVPTTTTSTTTSTTSTTNRPAGTVAHSTVPTTTAPPAAEPPPREFVLLPDSGPNNTPVVARGTGCSGSRAGVSLEFFDPSGRHYTSDGAASLPDGTWWMSFVFTAESPTDPLGGVYQVRASCRADTAVLFEYEARTFTLFR